MSSPSVKPFVRPAAQWEPYTQAEPAGAAFVRVINRDEIPGLMIGRVTLTGPIHKTPATHTECDQVYFVLSGQGVVHLAGKTHPLNGSAAVAIPRHTHHSVEVAAGETLQYIYINQYHSQI